MSHKTLPIYSVQFHPEAVLTKYGHELLQNFLNLCKEWHQKGDTNTMKPLVKKSEHFCPVDAIFHHLYMNHADAVLLDSSLHNQYGEYSIIGLHSYMTLINDHGQATCNGEPIEESFEEYLSAYLDSHIQPNHTGLPIISGAIGYFNYDYGRKKEVSTRHTEDERMPESILKFYDNFIIESHRTGELFLTACGNLESVDASMKKLMDLVDTVLTKHYNLSAIPEEALPIQVSANFEKQDYMDTVERMRQYIIEGDIYIANMTQKLKIQSVKSPYDTFLKLRAINPSPFGAYMDYGDFQIVCASPERFMRVQSRQVETRPIKGTRKRSKDPQEDANLRQELQESGKDKSELLMIVDLERNDLHRVCETGSVQVTELFTVEAYATVFHLVSTIVGRLKKDKNIVDLLEATFPGGSITGAPKIRAMEIIDELEHSNRGLYTGSIGYIGLDGNCDLNIVIRTALHQDGVYYLGVGGGITYESELEFEYEETLQKAKAILDALQ
jgi:para-aminobenzoate synthetase component 1